jgi:hypothetical protein
MLQVWQTLLIWRQVYVKDWFLGEWPWYAAGPLIGLFVPALLLAGNKVFGISGNLRHLSSPIVPGKLEFFRYDWRRAGL